MEGNASMAINKNDERGYKGAMAPGAEAGYRAMDRTVSARSGATPGMKLGTRGRELMLQRGSTLLLILLLVAAPCLVYGQSSPPPVGAPLVREGDFAVSLVQALGIGNTTNEVEAENLLGDVGIAPRNGWIADYPVTPDIVGELQAAVSDAADAGRIPLTKDEALQKFADVNGQMGLAVVPYTGSPPGEAVASSGYLNPEGEGDYYVTEGPPVVTYYAPPPDFYYLYAWVPYPFTCAGFYFPGFFVLHDFHRGVRFHHRPFFVSNHFNDIDRHRVLRIDPEKRFAGRTFAGIGAPRSGSFVSSGVQSADRRIFNAPPAQIAPRGSTNTPGSAFNASPVRTAPRVQMRTPGTVFSAPHVQMSSPGTVFSAPHTQMAPEGRMNHPGFGGSGNYERGFGGHWFAGQRMSGGFSHGGFRG